MPGNWNRWELADKVADGVRSAGSTPIEVHTIAVNNGFTIGAEKTKAVLVSREIVVDSICTGAGACGSRFTANAMATANEVLGSSTMAWNDIPASDPLKAAAALACVPLVVDRGITPHSLVTRRSFEKAIAGVMAAGGSTKAVLDLRATANDFGLHCRRAFRSPLRVAILFHWSGTA
jgi:dihydroxyacid dehydratase/phosphogluconate dehydratase